LWRTQIEEEGGVFVFLRKMFKRKPIIKIIEDGIESNKRLEKDFINEDPENRHIDKFGRPWKRINGEWVGE